MLRFIILFSSLYLYKSCFGICELPLKKFSIPEPIFIQNGKLISPSSTSGTIRVEESESLIVSCVEEKILLNKETTNISETTATCVSGTTFQVEDWTGDFSAITCSDNPVFTTEKTKTKCYDNNYIYRTGYVVGGEFYNLYDICFDPDRAFSYYSNHSISPSTDYIQTGITRPNFIENGLFPGLAMGDDYKSKNQKVQFKKILGTDKHITKKNYLARGHLSPRADFSMNSEQRATFQFANVAPQWMKGNGGDWAALEEAIRNRVVDHGRKVQIYTGTYGIMTLPDENNNEVEMYLSTDSNNNYQVPIPMYFYKIVYDSLDKSALTFVSINSPYYTEDQLSALTFCKDLSSDSRFAWLKWRPNDDTTSFICDYNSFKKFIPHIKLSVKKVFY